jgi:CRP-like cAMP-binding protein
MTSPDTAARRALLAKVPVFADLAPRELDALAGLTHTRKLAAREVLFHKGDPVSQVYVVVRGRLRVLAQSADGTDVVFGILDPGEVVGEIALLAGGQRTASVLAIEPSELLGLDRRDFLALLRSRPQLSVRLLQVLAERLRRISEFVEDTVFLDLPTRLAKKLLALATSYGKPLDAGGVRIDVKLSQQELGTMVGTTRESINKQLRAWREQGIVTSERGFLVIRRAAELERLAGLHAG